jgi:hypothetical protein
MPTFEQLSKMSGKGVAALFGRVPTDEEDADNQTPKPTVSEVTGSGQGSGTNGGQYVWNGNNWVWVDSDGGDDNTDGSVASGNGSGNGEDDNENDDEKDRCELPESLRGDVDCDGDYDEYDQEYWEYFWKDEDQSIMDMEEEYM